MTTEGNQPIDETAAAETAAIAACQKGDRDAFETIVRNYASRAAGVARSILRDAVGAEDASQEAFIRAYRAIHRFDLKERFYPWFYRILKNVCLTRLKKRKIADFSLDAENAPPLEADPDDPADRVAKQELRATIFAAMDLLSDPHREIIYLAHFEQLSYNEIAGCLSIPNGTVMSRLWAARKALKKHLGPLVQHHE